MKRHLVNIVVVLTVSFTAHAMADTPTPYPAFTFKKAGVPSAGSTSRIKVQISPADQLMPVVPKSVNDRPRTKLEDVMPDKPAVKSGLDWYWEGVSPKLEASNSGRLADAVAYLTLGPAGKTVPTPRMQQMQKIAKDYGTDILKATIGTKVSPALVLAVIRVESAGKPSVVSGAGAMGLMQLMPATAERFGVKDATVVAQNIKGGVAYLDWLMKKFNQDPVLVLAAYNAGEGAIKKHSGVPPYPETRSYVPKVLAAWTVAKGLCMTPPELISDGCVFGAAEAVSK